MTLCSSGCGTTARRSSSIRRIPGPTWRRRTRAARLGAVGAQLSPPAGSQRSTSPQQLRDASMSVFLLGAERTTRPPASWSRWPPAQPGQAVGRLVLARRREIRRRRSDRVLRVPRAARFANARRTSNATRHAGEAEGRGPRPAAAGSADVCRRQTASRACIWSTTPAIARRSEERRPHQLSLPQGRSISSIRTIRPSTRAGCRAPTASCSCGATPTKTGARASSRRCVQSARRAGGARVSASSIRRGTKTEAVEQHPPDFAATSTSASSSAGSIQPALDVLHADPAPVGRRSRRELRRRRSNGCGSSRTRIRGCGRSTRTSRTCSSAATCRSASWSRGWRATGSSPCSGVSGSGKSSLVRAGLIPALERGGVCGGGPALAASSSRSPAGAPFERLAADLAKAGSRCRRALRRQQPRADRRSRAASRRREPAASSSISSRSCSATRTCSRSPSERGGRTTARRRSRRVRAAAARGQPRTTRRSTSC